MLGTVRSVLPRHVAAFPVGLLWVALAGAPVVALVLPEVAHAADPLPATGLATVLPVGGVAGDGHTEIAVNAILRLPTGSPITGAKLKATATAGTVGEVVEVGDGVYAVAFVPPKVEGPTTVTVTFKGRTTELGGVEISRTIPVGPALEGRIAVSSSAPALVLGQDATATLTFAVPTSAGTPPTAGDLVVRTSSGTVSNIEALGGGRFTATFTTPALNFPHLALVTVVDRRNPGRVWGTLSLPLQGKVDYPVTAPPGANVTLRVGGKDFGPALSSAAGRASVSIIVPPGVTGATQIISTGGASTESPLDLRVPDARRIEMFSLPASIPSDSRVGVPVRVVVTRADGTPDPAAQVTLTATAGRVTDPRHAGDGVFLATYTPPDGRAQMAATLQASIAGSSTQTASSEVTLVPALPASVELSAEPGTLSPDGTGLKLYATVAGLDGTGLPGRALRFSVAGATQKGDVVDLKGGDYRGDFSTSGNTDVYVRGVALSGTSANAVRRVVLLPAFPAVAPGAAQPILVVAADEFGYPVANATVTLAVAEGGGSVPASVTTDANGIAEFVYRAGPGAGLAAVEARAGDGATAASFLQSTGSFNPLPLSGAPEDRAASVAWRAAQSVVLVDRDGGADAPIGDVATVAAVATAGLSVVATPAQAPAGSTVALDVRLADDAGVGIVGAPVEFFATGGARVGPVTDLGGGQYRAELFVPADATGSIKVNVVAEGGKRSQLVEVAIGAATGGDLWGTGTGAPLVTAPVASLGTSSAPEEVEEEGPDRPFFRLRASFIGGSYVYEQTPSENPGPLLPSKLGWGGENGGAPSPVGVEANARVIVPQVPYIGFNANFRWLKYSVASAEFSNPAKDNLFNLRVDAIARYPIEIKKSELSFGARVGFRFDDFITFEGCAEAGCTIEYGPVRLPGLGAGLEIGAEIGPIYLLAAGGAGFAYGSVPYAATADFNVGWNITKNVFVDAGFGYLRRRADLQGGDSGEVLGTVTDSLVTGSVGVGVSF